MIINSSQNSVGGLNLQKLVRSFQKKPEEFISGISPEATVVPDSANAAPQLVSKQNSSSSLMSRNFTSADQDESRYLKATKNSFHVSTQMNMKMQSTATSILDSLGGIKGPSLYDPHINKKSGGAAGATEWQIRKLLAQKDTEKMMKEMQEELRRKRDAERAAEALARGEILNEGEGNTIPALGAMSCSSLDLI